MKFIIIGNNNAITYKEFFPYIKQSKVWLGRTLFVSKMPFFKVPDDYPLTNERFERRADGLYKQVNRVAWFTNMPNFADKAELELTKKYNPNEYKHYDNYDAIEVERISRLPVDYDIAGVPITGLKHLWNDGTLHFSIGGKTVRFEIIKFRKGNDDKDLSVNGKCPYFRILIKKL